MAVAQAPRAFLDVVIPTCEKDYPNLCECIKSVLDYVVGVRTVWLVSRDEPPLAGLAPEHRARVAWVDEATGPVTLCGAATHVGAKREAQDANGVGADYRRLGWLYQQCIKLDASSWIPTLSRWHLIVDSDLVFFRRTTMVEDNVGLLSWQPDYKHAPYFEHLDRLTGGAVGRVDEAMSGVAHHMVFDEVCLRALRALVAEHNGGAPLWRAFLECCVVDLAGDVTAASEYELYFNYALGTFPKTHRARALRIRDNSGSFDLAPDVSFLMGSKLHHRRMIGPRHAGRDGADSRKWSLAAYHCRVLPLQHFVLSATKDAGLRKKIVENPAICVHLLKGIVDAPHCDPMPDPDR